VPTNPHEVPLRNRDGSGFFIAPHPVLVRDAVRYVGEPVAIVIAETLAAAMDAAEQVGVVYEAVAAVARSQDALSSGAPPVSGEHGSIRFAEDSPLEGDGFEPSVPRDRDDLRATTGSESARVANGRRFRSWCRFAACNVCQTIAMSRISTTCRIRHRRASAG
jgi:CO/xanthine dehydrogenase Mo-binding subunit